MFKLKIKNIPQISQLSLIFSLFLCVTEAISKDCKYQKTIYFQDKKIISANTIYNCKEKLNNNVNFKIQSKISKNNFSLIKKRNRPITHSEYMNYVYYGNKKKVTEVLQSLGIDKEDNNKVKNILSIIIKLIL